MVAGGGSFAYLVFIETANTQPGVSTMSNACTRFLRAAPFALAVFLASQSLIGCAAGVSFKSGGTFNPAESIRAAKSKPARYDERQELTELIERVTK